MKRPFRSLGEILESTDYTEPQELAKAMRISTPTIYSLVRQNKIPFVKIGQLVRFDPVELRAWLDARKAETMGSRRIAQ